MLDSKDVMSLFRLSKTTLWRHIKEGKFPLPVYVGRAPLWHQTTLEGWLGEKIGAPPRSNRKRDYDELC